MKKFLIILLFSAVLISPSFVSAATAADLQTQINTLLAQIAQLQQQLTQLQGTTAVWCHTFNVNLKIGDRGQEVEALFNALTKEGLKAALHAEDTTDYFGEGIASAVTGFQEKYKSEILTPLGLKYGTGYVGLATKAKLNKLYGCSSTGVCVQVITPAKNQTTGECKNFPTPCDVPSGWLKVNSCSDTCGTYSDQVVTGSTSGGIVWGSNPYTDDSDFNKVAVHAGLISPGQTATIRKTSAGYLYNFSGSTKNGVTTLAWTTGWCGVTINLVSPVATPYLTVTSPNGGENWTIGETKRVSWGIANINYVRIYIEDVSGAIAGSGSTNYIYDGAIPISTSYFDWTIQKNQLPGYNLTFPRIYKIRIDGVNSPEIGAQVIVTDRSNNSFTIQETTTPSINLLSPNGGEKWNVGGSYNITWQMTGFVQPQCAVDLYKSGISSPFVNIVSSYSRNSYTWQIPFDLSAGKYKILVRCSEGGGTYIDESDNYFDLVYVPGIAINYPNSSITLTSGSTVNITWTVLNVVPAELNNYHALIYLWRGSAYLGRINSSGTSVSIGSYTWEFPKYFDQNSNFVTAPAGSDYMIKAELYKLSDSSKVAEDWSDNSFSIVAAAAPSITVLSPNGGEVWHPGETRRISWNSNNVNSVQIYLYDPTVPESGGTIYVTPNNNPVSASLGYYDWTIPSLSQLPAVGGTSYKIRVQNASNANIQDSSNAVFSIISTVANEPSITITSPVMGQQIKSGSTYTVRWDARWIEMGQDIYVYYRVTGGDWVYIAYLGYNENSYSWTIPFMPGNTSAEIWVGVWENGRWLASDSVNVTILTALGLNDIQNMLASISQAVSQIGEGIKELIGR